MVDLMGKDISKLKMEIKELKLMETVSVIKLLNVLEEDEEQFHFYTGSSFDSFKILVDFLGPAMNNLTKMG